MQVQFTGLNLEITQALKDFTNDKFKKLNRFAELITSIHVVFNVDKVLQKAEAKINLHGSEIVAHSESDHNMYEAIDALVDKLVRQLTKYKEKHESHRS
jgi:putative sigma-54 modulation protein